MAGMFEQMAQPGAPMKNSMTPKPRGPVIGPPKVKMPSTNTVGQPQVRASSDMFRSSLGPKLKPLPTNPMQPTQGHTSLLQSSGGKNGFDGLRPKGPRV